MIPAQTESLEVQVAVLSTEMRDVRADMADVKSEVKGMRGDLQNFMGQQRVEMETFKRDREQRLADFAATCSDNYAPKYIEKVVVWSAATVLGTLIVSGLGYLLWLVLWHGPQIARG